MSLFDSCCHAFGTVSTSGYSPYNASIGHYNSAYFDWVIIVFMFLGGVTFMLYYHAARGDWKTLRVNTELRWYLGFMLVLCGGVTWILWRDGTYDFPDALRYGTFQVTSLLTTTGFTTADYELWPQAVLMILVLAAVSDSLPISMTDAQQLVAWFQSNARPLPWRTVPRDPYSTLVSELMAQQTQMERVVPRFEAFVRRFPHLGVLAAASEDEVLGSWSGLGYYRRARLLHRLAREVTAGDGRLPTTAAELERLPGIGPYTAAAVASMVFGEAVPLIDGNVTRVGARVLALADDPRENPGKKTILRWVSGLMTGIPPGDVNEGLMELGAMVCTPSRPDCGNCPLAASCRARDQGNPETYPPPRTVRQTVKLAWLALIAETADGRWLFKQVLTGPILRGLWLPPFTEIDTTRSLEEQALELLPFQASTPIVFSEPIKHSITHRRIEITPARVGVKGVASLKNDWLWADPSTPNLPTSSLLGKLVRSTES